MIERLIGELARQDAKWGEQNHPLIGPRREKDRWYYAESERDWKRINDLEEKDGCPGWDGVLLEEVYEALTATEKSDQVEELVQVAAVAIQAAMALERAA